jgi:hypothetical protein
VKRKPYQHKTIYKNNYDPYESIGLMMMMQNDIEEKYKNMPQKKSISIKNLLSENTLVAAWLFWCWLIVPRKFI